MLLYLSETEIVVLLPPPCSAVMVRIELATDALAIDGFVLPVTLKAPLYPDSVSDISATPFCDEVLEYVSVRPLVQSPEPLPSGKIGEPNDGGLVGDG